MNPSSVLPELIEASLTRLTRKYRNSKDKFFTDEELLELNQLFGPVLERALHVLDSRTIVLYRLQYKLRELAEIQGRVQNLVYKLFPHVNYCSCPSFVNQVIEQRVQYTCKHVLALRIAQILGKVEERILTDDQFKCMMKNLVVDEN